MKRYLVTWTETIVYEMEVEAETREDALRKAEEDGTIPDFATDSRIQFEDIMELPSSE